MIGLDSTNDGQQIKTNPAGKTEQYHRKSNMAPAKLEITKAWQLTCMSRSSHIVDKVSRAS